MYHNIGHPFEFILGGLWLSEYRTFSTNLFFIFMADLLLPPSCHPVPILYTIFSSGTSSISYSDFVLQSWKYLWIVPILGYIFEQTESSTKLVWLPNRLVIGLTAVWYVIFPDSRQKIEVSPFWRTLFFVGDDRQEIEGVDFRHPLFIGCCSLW